MQVPTISVKQKTVIIEVLILLAFLGGGYYLYTYFFTNATTTTAETASGDGLLGKNFTTFINATTKEKISFKEVIFLKKPLVGMLVDYSEIISPNATRGRLDPFLPYASSRPLR